MRDPEIEQNFEQILREATWKVYSKQNPLSDDYSSEIVSSQKKISEEKLEEHHREEAWPGLNVGDNFFIKFKSKVINQQVSNSCELPLFTKMPHLDAKTMALPKFKSEEANTAKESFDALN